MHRWHRPLAVLLLTVAAVLTPARAAEFSRFVADKSQIQFAYRQMGVPSEGRFRKFSVQFVFDPVKPATSRTLIEVEPASAETGIKDVDEELKNAAWFDVRRYPVARFESSQFRALGGGRFEIAGRLTIKGKTRDLTVPMQPRMDGAAIVLEGSFPLKRLEFGVGTGSWSDTATVADEVQVRFRITLNPTP